jgi:hypothetical protein
MQAERREIALAWTLFIGGLFVYIACIWMTQAVIDLADHDYKHKYKRPGPEALWARHKHQGPPPEYADPEQVATSP